MEAVNQISKCIFVYNLVTDFSVEVYDNVMLYIHQNMNPILKYDAVKLT